MTNPITRLPIATTDASTFLTQAQAAQTGAEAAQSAAEDALASTQATAAFVTAPYETRAGFIAGDIPLAVTRTSFFVGGNTYAVVRDAAGPIVQTNGQRWRPDGDVHLEHFGAVGDGVANDAPAWEAAMDHMDVVGGGVIDLAYGSTYACGPITFASNVTLRMNGATLAVHPSTPKTGNWLVNRDVSDDGTRACVRTRIEGPGVLDGYAREFDRWLSRLDGTPITDPEADYVAGTGALASGISGVSLTAVLSGDAVASVTVNTGGSGWNGHPTLPYTPNTVPVRFDGGGGSGAAGFATVSGGTLASVTITDGGAGYTSPPTVTTMGGYADISLLVDPSVNRRNPNYNTSGNGISFSKVAYPAVENVKIQGFRCRALSDGGCLGGAYRNIEFVDCGKNDGAFHLFWVQSFGTPGGGAAFYAPSEAPVIENIVAVDGIERSLALFAPTKGGTMRNITAKGCGESTLFIPDVINLDGGTSLIENFDLSDCVIADIVGNLVETAGSRGLTLKNGRLAGSANSAIQAQGATDFLCENVVFENNGTGLSTLGPRLTPYGPFAERYGFAVGTRPRAGVAVSPSQLTPIAIGSIGAKGGKNCVYRGNTFREYRAVFPPTVFVQTKSGSNSIAGETIIEGNDFTGVPSGMGLLDRTVGAVWLANMPLSIRGNRGHVSETPVVVPQQINATGTYTITPGFRPRYVEVFAAMNNGALFRTFSGAFSWQRSGVRNDFGLAQTTSFSAGGQIGRIADQDVIRLVDDANTTTVLVEFSSWIENGFVLSCNTYGAGGLVNTRFVCHP